MAIQGRDQLKGYFEKGDKPTEEEFANLIDSCYNKDEDVIGIYIPETQPIVTTGTITLNCDNEKELLFEPRLNVGTLPINVNFEIVLSNDSNAILISMTCSLAGTRTITFPSNFLCSNASSLGVWDNALKTLELSAGTADIIEFQMLYYASTDNWLLKVSEIPLT